MLVLVLAHLGNARIRRVKTTVIIHLPPSVRNNFPLVFAIDFFIRASIVIIYHINHHAFLSVRGASDSRTEKFCLLVTRQRRGERSARKADCTKLVIKKRKTGEVKIQLPSWANRLMTAELLKIFEKLTIFDFQSTLHYSQWLTN
jgi:hypothetical protein